MFTLRFSFACSLAVASFALAADQLPLVPQDWKVEVVAKPPELIHPSVVTCAPDGRVFVAQDPIDMALPSDAAGDSILCIHPDGHITKFADNLHAVYGLLYLDGKLYVHHTPNFSVFTDDNGVGKDRRDLFNTNPNPNLAGKGFNDHIPSNVHLGMDGWIYMSSGDKGIFGAVGQDGSRVDLRGGGLIRFRPDGTHLELYTSGTRNHLDVAINAEEEMFTYDNTDDGNGWWTRVTHMVDGGFYGYPFDYKPRRPYTLWMMTDYGGGSGTGGLAYNEDALPPEYRGNLFMEDWGRKQLLRLKVSRDGATFKVDERAQIGGKDFVTQGGTTEFRPVGITTTPDGLGFYITDWNYGGWKAKNVVAGRLLKVTYTGPSQAAPKPAWWTAAGTGKNFTATNTELVAALKHPAQSVRLVAQRRLAERGADVVAPLKALLADATAPAYARWHAIWALDAIDAGLTARNEILALARGGDDAPADASVRAQAIRQLGTRRVVAATPVLSATLRDPDPIVRFRAATALGRIADATATSALSAALDEKDFFTRYAIFTALRRIGTAQPDAWAQIANGFASENPAIREGTLFAMREAFDDRNVDALVGVVVAPDTRADSRKAALGALAELHRLAPIWDGKWWGTQPVLREKPAPKTIEWTKTATVLDAIRFSLRSPDESIRRTAVDAVATTKDSGAAAALRALFAKETATDFRRAILRTLGAIKDLAASSLVAQALDDASLRDDAIAVAGQLGDPASVAALTKLADAAGAADQLVRIVDALGTAKVASTAPTLGKLLAHDDAKVRAAAGQALANVGGKPALDVVLPLLDAEKLETRRAAIVAAGLLKDKKALVRLLELAKVDATSTDAVGALAAMPDMRALDLYLDAIVSGRLGNRTGGSNANNARPNQRLTGAIDALKDQALPVIERRHLVTPFKGQALAALQRIYNRDDKALAGPLFAGASKPVDPAEYLKFALRDDGDATRGKRFFEGAAGCTACHRVNGAGGQIGPDLSDVATKYDRTFLAESVLYPSKQILDGYHLMNVALKDGGALAGFLRSQTDDNYTIVDAAGENHVLKKSDVTKMEETNQSLMPAGLQASLSLAEFSDLITYLQSLKAKPASSAN